MGVNNQMRVTASAKKILILAKRVRIWKLRYMSEFVNFNKRDISLPAGCKDLFDLLQRSSRRKNPSLQQPLMQSPDFSKMRELMAKVKQGPSIQTKGLIADAGKYIDMVLRSTATTACLTVSTINKHLEWSFHNYQFKEKEISASVQVEMKTNEQKELKGFCDRHGFEAPDDSDTPGFFNPQLPVYLTCEIEPLPLDASSIIRLLNDLFGETCDMAENGEVEITYDEATYPPEVLKYFEGLQP